MLLVSRESLDQDCLDDLAMEDALVPQLRSRSKVVPLPEALLDELLSYVPADQVSAERPQRKECHRLRKLVRTLNGRERKAIRLLFFKEMSNPEVLEAMKLRGDALDEALTHAFARLREGLSQIPS